MTVAEGSVLGDATPVEVIEAQPTASPESDMGMTVGTSEPAIVSQVHAQSISRRKEELAECVGPTDLLNSTNGRSCLLFWEGTTQPLP